MQFCETFFNYVTAAESSIIGFCPLWRPLILSLQNHYSVLRIILHFGVSHLFFMVVIFLNAVVCWLHTLKLTINRLLSKDKELSSYDGSNAADLLWIMYVEMFSCIV